MPVRRILVLPLLMVVCMGLELPQQGPLPKPNPHPSQSSGATPAIPTARPEDGSQKPDAAVNPRAGAAGPTTVPGDPPGTSEPQAADKPAPLPGIVAPVPDEAALAACEAELRKLGADFSREQPVRGENGCGIQAPYRIEKIIRGVTLAPASQMRCDTALALARWTATVVVPAAAAMPDSVTLTQINHGSTYVCRRRNNLATGKMSEHAIGNAVDIVSFEFAGRKPIGIAPRTGDGNMDEAFQRAVRAGACLHFTTVLGPGANASHAGHLHLDIAKRSRGYRLCE